MNVNVETVAMYNPIVKWFNAKNYKWYMTICGEMCAHSYVCKWPGYNVSLFFAWSKS